MEIDLSKRQALIVDPKAYNKLFIGNLDGVGNTTILFHY